MELWKKKWSCGLVCQGMWQDPETASTQIVSIHCNALIVSIHCNASLICLSWPQGTYPISSICWGIQCKRNWKDYWCQEVNDLPNTQLSLVLWIPLYLLLCLPFSFFHTSRASLVSSIITSHFYLLLRASCSSYLWLIYLIPFVSDSSLLLLTHSLIADSLLSWTHSILSFP